jgi:hypothetical protein
MMNKSPTQKQIVLADNIAKTLGLEFPRGSYDFSSRTYWEFINKNIEKYNEVTAGLEDPTYGLLGEFTDWDLYDMGMWEF